MVIFQIFNNDAESADWWRPLRISILTPIGKTESSRILLEKYVKTQSCHVFSPHMKVSEDGPPSSFHTVQLFPG